MTNTKKPDSRSAWNAVENLAKNANCLESALWLEALLTEPRVEALLDLIAEEKCQSGGLRLARESAEETIRSKE